MLTLLTKVVGAIIYGSKPFVGIVHDAMKGNSMREAKIVTNFMNNDGL